MVTVDNRETLWLYWPICNSKTRTKVYKTTTLINFPLFCPKCKRETAINIVKLKMSVNTEPDA
ncbi:MAG: conjugal transfer protein [Ruminococcaceae bacterium]|nr:conjugal transfer protein [Oscillospiraceae bacterium]